MDTLILYHHLGLGDHLMCHGLVRETCKKYPKVIIFAKSHNLVSVQFMFRDIPNLEIVEGDDDIAKAFLREHPEMQAKLIGFGKLNWVTGAKLDIQFYEQAGLPIDKKYSEFKVVRDSEREEALFDKLVPEGVEDYIFLHHDPERHFGIKPEFLPDLPVVQPSPDETDCIFDYCKIIENASELHLIDSAFQHMTDLLSPYNGRKGQKLVIHRYARQHLFNNAKQELERLLRSEVGDVIQGFQGLGTTTYADFEVTDWHLQRGRDLYLSYGYTSEKDMKEVTTESIEAPTRQKEWEILV